MATEKEKMLAGDLYNAADPQLVLERRRAKNMCRTYNATRDEEQEKRQQILFELLGAKGTQVDIQPPFYCDYGYNITLGEGVFFNYNCIVLDVCQVEIGDGAMFGPNVQIYTATHPLDFETRSTGLEMGKPIKIGAHVWIGGSVVIGPGVTIGDRSVIGTGSVVVKDVPADVFAAGNPCRMIRSLKS